MFTSFFLRYEESSDRLTIAKHVLKKNGGKSKIKTKQRQQFT